MSRFYGFYYLATRAAQEERSKHADPEKRETPPESNAGFLVLIVAVPLVIVATLLLIFTA